MAINIYDTVSMAGVVRELPQLYTFFKDRYFGAPPTLFTSEKVIVDYDDGDGNIMAPFVIPRAGSVPIMREGYTTNEIIPANIAPSRPLSIDDITKRMAGENIVSNVTPEQRERVLLADDLKMLDNAITRREEWMCVNTMLDNACTMKHIGDKKGKGIDLTAQYYDGTNDGVFTADTKWAVGTASARGTWYDGVCKQIDSLTAAGRQVTDLVVGSEVASMILSDPWIKDMLDNKRIELGEINPQWQPAGVTRLGAINFDGVMLEIFCYKGTYQEREEKNGKFIKTVVPYFPAKGALLAAPNTGKLLYGAVTQVEQDEMTYTRTGTRIPKHNVDKEHDARETILKSRPIAAPIMKSPWRACRNVL